MKAIFFSVKQYERPYLRNAQGSSLDITLTGQSLSEKTVDACHGYDAVSVFTNDDLSSKVIEKLATYGVRYIATRATGVDNIDIASANRLGIRVANVPEYSPYAIAEHAVGLMLALNRKLIIADRQVRNQDFTTDKLVGFDLHGKTVGIIGTGSIGKVIMKILHGFGCRLIAHDIAPKPELALACNAQYVSLEDLCHNSDIITMHVPLTPQTKQLIDKEKIGWMKKGVMLINTGRGGSVNTADVIDAIKSGQIGYFGSDVYEYEHGLFFHDLTGKDIPDNTWKELMKMPNVLITPHQGFATVDALSGIITTTLHTIYAWRNGAQSLHEIRNGHKSFPVKKPAESVSGVEGQGK